MTNEAGLQYEDLLKAKEIMSEPGKYIQQKEWTTKDIPYHLSYIVACNVGCIPRYSVFL